MSSESLNPRLRHFLANRLGWRSLRDVQKSAIEAIGRGEDTLIVAPTASGKTEAAMIPVFNSILTEGLPPVSLLYVSPLKALINDMHSRLEYWGNHFNLEVMKWHGDVPPDTKRRFIRNPADILLITPESLEVIMVNRSRDERERIFRNLRYIIVDEIHYFIESDRGVQLNSLLARLERYTAARPQRIGLSATVGNPEDVLEWMSPSGVVVKESSDRRLQYRIFSGGEAGVIDVLRRLTGRKVLIFVPSRREAERYYNIIRRCLDVDVFIHHSSLNRESREEAEEKFKSISAAFMVSTSTLELGIDVGDIDVVVHLRSPTTVNQFLQRTGRSGRRSGNQRTIIFHEGEVLLALSVVSLALSGKLEMLRIPGRPLDIYFHQILSSVFEIEKPGPAEIYRGLGRAHVFSDINQGDFRHLLEFMGESDFIRKHGTYLYHGFNFEKVFGKMNFLEFYSVFYPTYEFTVKHGTKTIGTLDAFFAVKYLEEGRGFVLGGENWIVREIDHEKFIVKVKPCSRKANIPDWSGGGAPVSFEVARHAYDILLGNFNRDILRWLDDASRERVLSEMARASAAGLTRDVIPVSVGSDVEIHTFGGERVNGLISDIFRMEHDAYRVRDDAFAARFRAKVDYDDVVSTLNEIPSIISEDDFPLRLHDRLDRMVKNKFIEHLPEDVAAHIKYSLLYRPDELMGLLEASRPVEVEGFRIQVFHGSKK
ncbi:DEAD/DEAH box helicase [Methanothermobacter sp. DP]|uniref:DEAD/DEAH box helicase n=1 Tax=Methanothermobacter sp. DP TaxID=2998972 RepID=UPI002AA59493|nr:DEAD/DEAH box helicase [Methanothermobacter sp. DP]